MVDNNKLEEFKKKINSCEKCVLAQTKTNIVFGEGNPKSMIMLVGEGPGENEDLMGKPFVGKAGQLLDKMLKVIDLSRDENVYITNIVKCRPPKNRDPEEYEQDACIGYLFRQIEIINPKIIIALGRIAAKKLIDEKFKVSLDHGKWIKKNNIYFMGTYHPSALLRFANRKEDAFQDFLSIREKIKELDIQL